jgi:hypothetical protein
MLKLFHPRVARHFLPSFIGMLENPSSKDEELNGAIFMLLTDKAVKRIIEDWDLLSQFLLALVRCQP